MTTERILIVDDEETLCEVLKMNLENEGYDVDIAFSAEQALTLDLKSYALILLDIMMGEISGIKMAKMLKADVSTASIPIIFTTARAASSACGRGYYNSAACVFLAYSERIGADKAVHFGLFVLVNMSLTVKISCLSLCSKTSEIGRAHV